MGMCVTTTTVLCECGCGQPAPIAKYTKTSAGHVKGQPVRFVRGHHGRSSEVRAKISARRREVGNDGNRGKLREYKPRDGDASQARSRVTYLITAGRLSHPRTLPCTDCGQRWAPGLSRHEYDHHLGYGAEHHEHVEPVCARCHNKRERDRGKPNRWSNR